jgi:hypothetical protein
MEIALIVLGFTVAGFVSGILVGRNNAKKVEKIISDVEKIKDLLDRP